MSNGDSLIVSMKLISIEALQKITLIMRLGEWFSKSKDLNILFQAYESLLEFEKTRYDIKAFY